MRTLSIETPASSCSAVHLATYDQASALKNLDVLMDRGRRRAIVYIVGLPFLTALCNQTAPNFFKGMFITGFNFNRFVAKDLAKFNQGSNADVFGRLLEDADQHEDPGRRALDNCTGEGVATMRARC